MSFTPSAGCPIATRELPRAGGPRPQVVLTGAPTAEQIEQRERPGCDRAALVVRELAEHRRARRRNQ
jgi:hypothetical protein